MRETPLSWEDRLATGLTEHDFAIDREFLSHDQCELIRLDFLRLQSQGAFSQAGIGHAHEHGVDLQVRRDQVFWFPEVPASLAQELLCVRFQALKAALNERLLLGLWSFEGHYAAYDKGGFYQRHRDSFRGDDSRVISTILYLNESWQDSDGGQLRLFLKNGSLDIVPNEGTLVCFLSHLVEHEVLPAQAPRRSFAGWFKKRNSGVYEL